MHNIVEENYTQDFDVPVDRSTPAHRKKHRHWFKAGSQRLGNPKRRQSFYLLAPTPTLRRKQSGNASWHKHLDPKNIPLELQTLMLIPASQT
jgi:hypothetical protein